VLAAGGVDVVGTQRFREVMEQRGAMVEVLAPVAGGTLRGGSGGELPVDRVFTTMASVSNCCAPHIDTRLAEDTDADSDRSVVTTTAAADEPPDWFVDEFAAVLARHHCWERQTDPVPA
jgi:catalase